MMSLLRFVPSTRSGPIGGARGIRFVVLATVLVATFAFSAEAFRPSSRWLVQSAMALSIKRNIKSLHATFDVVRYDVASHPKGYATERRDIYRAPNQLRRETDLEAGTLLEVQNGARALYDIPGQGRKKQKARPTLWDLWFTVGPPAEAGPTGKKVVARMTNLGIDLDTVSYSRFDGRVNYVIGAKPWEKAKPQAWLDKESMHLTRVIWPQTGADGTKTRREMRFLGWGSAVGGDWLPEIMERYEGDKLIERATLTAVERNQPVDKDLLAID